MIAMLMLVIALVVGVVGIGLLLASWIITLVGMASEQYLKSHIHLHAS
ncbi:MAG: hypothetical protein ACYC99_05460 [Candidatus Geothermincolia bacterium]